MYVTHLITKGCVLVCVSMCLGLFTHSLAHSAVVVVVLLVAVAGGVAVWWFFIRNGDKPARARASSRQIWDNSRALDGTRISLVTALTSLPFQRCTSPNRRGKGKTTSGAFDLSICPCVTQDVSVRRRRSLPREQRGAGERAIMRRRRASTARSAAGRAGRITVLNSRRDGALAVCYWKIVRC